MEKIFKIHCSQISKIMGNSKPAGNLSAACKTYLMEWYAGEREEIHSKYLDKGNMCEIELIDFAAMKLNLGLAEKNTVRIEDEYMTGECDIDFPSCIVDVKASWDNKTLQSQCEGMDEDYELQGIGYMHLYKKDEFILFFGLVDTPEEVNYGNEISYQHIPEDMRWIAYKIKADYNKILEIKAKVVKCREWLVEYDVLVKSKLGKINEQ